MIAAEDTILILLAAGQSRRFGARDKLLEPFLGQPVGLHVVTALESIAFRERIVVTDGCTLDFASRGYRVVHNDDPSLGMGRSVRLGVEQADRDGARAVLIALADMPRVTASHIYRLLDAADSHDAVVASSDGIGPKPPAVFGAGRFDFLMTLEGDAGARDLVKSGRHVITTPAELIDIDTPDDLERLKALIHAPEVITRAGADRSD